MYFNLPIYFSGTPQILWASGEIPSRRLQRGQQRTDAPSRASAQGRCRRTRRHRRRRITAKASRATPAGGRRVRAAVAGPCAGATHRRRFRSIGQRRVQETPIRRIEHFEGSGFGQRQAAGHLGRRVLRWINVLLTCFRTILFKNLFKYFKHWTFSMNYLTKHLQIQAVTWLRFCQGIYVLVTHNVDQVVDRKYKTGIGGRGIDFSVKHFIT